MEGLYVIREVISKRTDWFNGIKKPNVFGKDVFVFTLWLNDRAGKPLKSWGCTSSRDMALTCCKNSSEKCAGLLELDNWEFKKDYPWR